MPQGYLAHNYIDRLMRGLKKYFFEKPLGLYSIQPSLLFAAGLSALW